MNTKIFNISPIIRTYPFITTQKRWISRRYEDHCTKIISNLSKELHDDDHKAMQDPLEWTSELDRKLLQHLEQSTITSLSKLSRQCGLAVDASPKKQTMIPQLYQRIHMSHRCFSPLGNNQKREFVFIDVGVRNMAWAVVDLSKRHVEHVGLQSLFPSVTAAHSLELAEMKNMPSDFALAVSRFVRQLKDTVSSDSIFVVEQQMQRHNPRCLIVEAQLHAFLLPNCLSVSPVTVSRSLGISSAPASKSKPEDPNVNFKSPLKRDQKKRISIRLVERILNLTADNNSNSLMTMSDGARERMVKMKRDGEKMDDICDCILNSLAFHLWLSRLHKQLMLQWRN